MHISPTTTEAWRVEAEFISSGEGGVVVEVRLSNSLMGRLPPFSITLEAEPEMSRADYEAQALILMAEAAIELEGACIRASLRKGS